MKNQYVGDFGDFIKYGVLCHLQRKGGVKKLGVVWYFTGDDDTTHGSQTGYLHDEVPYKNLDRELFEKLKKIVCDDGERKIERVQSDKVLGDASFSKTNAISTEMDKHCDLIFLDPDNGVNWRGGNTGEGHIDFGELQALWKKEKSILFYQTFGRSDNLKKMEEWSEKLKKEFGKETPSIIRSARYGTRAIILLTNKKKMVEAFEQFGKKWEKHIKPHGGSKIPCGLMYKAGKKIR